MWTWARPFGLATWRRGSRGAGSRLGVIWDLVCELTGESERDGHGGRGGYRGGAKGAARGVVTGGLGCEDDGGGVDMEGVGLGDRGGVGAGLGRAMVRRISEGVHRVGRKRNSQKACM